MLSLVQGGCKAQYKMVYLPLGPGQINKVFNLLHYWCMGDIYIDIAVPSSGGSKLMSPIKSQVHQTIEFSRAHNWVKHSDNGKCNNTGLLMIQLDTLS